MALFMIAAYVIFGVYPIIVSYMLEEGRATLPQMSRVCTADYISMGIASLAAPRLLSLDNIRVKGFIAAILIVVGDVWTLSLTGDMIILARLVSGMGSGVLIWLHYAYVARSEKAEALGGIFLAGFVAVSIVVSYLSSLLLVPLFGVNGIFYLIIAIASVTAFAALLGPNQFDRAAETLAGIEDEKGGPFPLSANMALASVFFMTASSSTVWLYLEPIAARGGIDRVVSDYAAILQLTLNFVGALLAAWLVHRVNYKRTLLVFSSVYILLGIFVLFGHITVPSFLAYSAISGIIGYAVVPFQISLLIKADPTRRAVENFSAPNILGSAFGPLVASIIVSEHDVDRGLALCLLWTILCFFAVSIAIMRLPKNTRAARCDTEASEYRPLEAI